MPALSGSSTRRAKLPPAPKAKAPSAKGVTGSVSAPAKAAPKNVGPTKKGIGPLPVPKKASSPISRKTFTQPLKSATKQNVETEKALFQYSKEHPQKPHHALLSLHTLKDLDTKAAGALIQTQSVGTGPLKTLALIPTGEAKAGKKGEVEPKPVGTDFAKAGLKDIQSIGEAPFVAGLKGGQAGVAALKGNLKPAKEFVKTTAESFKKGALGELAQGHIQGAEKAFHAHPGITVAELGGIGGIVGRTTHAGLSAAGSTTEGTGVRAAAARAASTVRPAIAHVDESGAVKAGAYTQRTYSKDSIRKAAQVARDKRREVVTDADNKPVLINDRGRKIPVLKPTAKEQGRLQAERANFESSKTQATEILNRDRMRKGLNKIEHPKAVAIPHIRGVGKELHQLVASGTIRSVATFKGDLEKRIATIEEALKNPKQYRNKDELKAAQKNLALLKKAAKDPKVLKQAPAIVERGLAAAKLLNQGDKRLAKLQVHPPGELGRAALSEYALAHMDARHGIPEAPASRGTWQSPHEVPLHEIDPKFKPESMVTVYRVTEGEGIKPGKGVLLEKPTHGFAPHSHVESMKVPAHTVFGDKEGALNRFGVREYGYHPDVASAVKSGEAQLLGPTGKPLSTEEIRAHAEAHGRNPDTLAYVPHTVGAGSKGAFHRPFRPGARPRPTGQTRTGVAYLRGQTAIGREILREEATRKATKANLAESLDKFTSESGVKRPDGKYFTGPEAAETAARLNSDGTSQYVPVRAFGANLPVDMQKGIKEAQSPAAMETAHWAMLNDRIVSAADTGNQARNVVLVPADQVNMLLRQLKPAGEFEKATQLLNAPFRMAVLPQPKWLTGNLLEPYVVRSTFSGAGLNIPGTAIDMRVAEKAVKGMEASKDPAIKRAADEVRSMQLGGMFIGRKGASVRRTYEDFTGNTAKALYAAHVARNLPVMKQMGDMVLSIPHAFFHVNRAIEGGAQRIALGKSVRNDLQQITGSWLRTIMTGKEALAEVQKGLVDTPTQHRFMKEQHEMLGQYNAFNPLMRKMTQTLFPFLPWVLNSLRFVYWTLPAHHTVAFTALMKASQGVQQEWEAEHKGTPPATLRDAIVRKDKGLVDIAKYTPFGATIPFAHDTAEGLQGLASTFAPQVSGPQKALEGQDPFGRPLQVPKTKSNPRGEPKGGEKLAIAGNEVAEAMVPLLGIGRRILEGGGTPYAPTGIGVPKTKPGTKHVSGPERALNPFRPTYLKPPKGSKPKGRGRKRSRGPTGEGASRGPIS